MHTHARTPPLKNTNILPLWNALSCTSRVLALSLTHACNKANTPFRRCIHPLVQFYFALFKKEWSHSVLRSKKNFSRLNVKKWETSMCHWVICPGEHHSYEIGSSYAKVSHKLSHASSQNLPPPFFFFYIRPSPFLTISYSCLYTHTHLCFTLSAVTINPYTWHQHDTQFYHFSVTTKPKIYFLLMLSYQLSMQVNALWEFSLMSSLSHTRLSFLFLYFCGVYLPPGNEPLSLKLEASRGADGQLYAVISAQGAAAWGWGPSEAPFVSLQIKG